MAILSIQKHLHILRQCVKESTVQGSFLISTGEVSNYWIPINKLRTHNVTSSVVGILQTCLPNFQHETNVGTVYVPQLTTTSEDIFPWDFVVNQLRSYMETTKQSMNFCSLNFDRHHNVVEIPEGTPIGSWLGAFAISVHVDMIVAVVDALRRHKREVNHVLVLVERDNVTRQLLQQRGIHLVPLIVCNESTGEPTTILDMTKSPYDAYHKYFVIDRSHDSR
jgi:hypothetical protein